MRQGSHPGHSHAPSHSHARDSLVPGIPTRLPAGGSSCSRSARGRPA